MSSHRAARGPAGMRRLTLATLALVVAAGLMIGNQGTLAFWRDTATVTGGQFTSGRLDLTVDGAQGLATSPYAKTTLALSGMLPGESVAQTLLVRNVGDAPFTWTATVTRSTGATDLGPGLVVEMWLGGAATAAGTTYPRVGDCTVKTTPLASGAMAPRLGTGAAGSAGQILCVKVSLPSTAGNEYQSRTTGSVTLGLTATQVTP